MPPAQQRRAGESSQIGDSRFIIFDKWSKMNTKVARQNLPEDQLAWLENLQPVSENVMQAIPGPNPTLTNLTGKTISRMFYVTISGVDYVACFTTDGGMQLVNISTGSVVTTVGPATFTNPDMVVFSSSVILIIDPANYVAISNASGSFIQFFSGGLSPNCHITAGGAGYTSAPTISFTGGHGSGATATAVIAGGAVVAINMTNSGSGYLPGDVVTVVFTGGGFSTVATATIVVWPQTTGTSIAIFAGRVWWANGRLLNFTGTGATTGVTYDDINPADASGSTTITDYDLAHSITAVRALNNFLYIFGDQSIKQVGSITVQSSITLFTILTLASDVGTSFLMSIQSYNRLVLFANKNGVYGIFGATVQKVSDDLDGIFQLVDFTQPISSALNDYHVNLPNTGGGSLHCYQILVKYNDPLQGPRPIILAYQTNKWFVVSQGSLIAIVGIPRGSSTQWETFGSSGSDITQLLQNGAVSVSVRMQTALSAHGNMIIAKQVIRSGVAATTQVAQTIMLTVDTENGSNAYNLSISSVINWVNRSGQLVQWQNNSLANVNFIGGGFRFPYTSTEGYGHFIGNTLTATGVTNMAINAIANEYQEDDLWGAVP